MYVRNPLLMFSPHFNHSSGGFQALIEYANCAVSKSGDEDIARDLVGRQRGDAGTRPSRNILENISAYSWKPFLIKDVSHSCKLQ